MAHTTPRIASYALSPLFEEADSSVVQGAMATLVFNGSAAYVVGSEGPTYVRSHPK